MVDEGDFEAARDYAKASGLSLDDAKPTGERKAQWAQFRKDGKVPAQPDTTPKEPSGYRLPDDVNKDWRDASGRSHEHPDYVPTARQQLLMDAVGRAVDVASELHLLTFCVLVLKNGFTVTGESACASPENFNAEIGRRIARENAVNKVWPLLGFRLRDKLAGAAET